MAVTRYSGSLSRTDASLQSPVGILAKLLASHKGCRLHAVDTTSHDAVCAVAGVRCLTLMAVIKALSWHSLV